MDVDHEIRPSCCCSLCGASDNLLRCSRCKGTYYCSKEHQRLNWKVHRAQCSPNDSAGWTQMEPRGTPPSAAAVQLQPQDQLCATGESNGVVEVGDLPPYLHRGPCPVPSDRLPSAKCRWMQTMCQYVIRDLDRYGICVIDNFAGQVVGDAIIDEVVSMYNGGRFVDGELVGAAGNANTARRIRGDKITWVNGTEPGCDSIGHLIRLVDAVVINSNRMPGNGTLGQYDISDRTRAMVACYPGGGTQYVKHVDNPNRDGRCITCIYYLNKDWDVQRDGGLLRIFPSDWKTSVADIDPVFDRILLFWSDRRNPHEVQPSKRTRWAITLWYYNRLEREKTQQRCPSDRCDGTQFNCNS